ncbi:hypothetical protein MBCUT_05990 [Methanobrevibacter cuticularis]|uniref:Uncharacterized protein n=1 Tax=Methanobrevibacter cuticularis TaxID=47311 RepID=A0A166EJU7_9EURY|nr:hypothetical protein [Methanobrevibacter cuticularis]KZX16735.1 hypothetical protein MBCUT_05990 [Methanobrevibacter cuticularis]
MKKKNIQIIGFDKKSLTDKFGESVFASTFKTPLDFNEFEFNFIDMTNTKIWENNEDNAHNINCQKDLIHLKEMIEESNKETIIMYPRESEFKFDSYGPTNAKKYDSHIDLKNNLDNIVEILQESFGIPKEEIKYTNQITKINDHNFISNFYFAGSELETITFSNSKKQTTLKANNIILTTILINSYEELRIFLEGIGCIKKSQKIPDWFTTIEMFDDDKQNEKIEEIDEEVLKLKSEKIVAYEKLKENNKYKSILYTQSTELETVVREILDEILDTNLSDFEDENLSDFLIELEDLIFIGEIKGLTKNLKTRNVSQLRTHKEEYLNEIEEARINEGIDLKDLETYIEELDNKIKPLMIVNRYLDILPDERERINSRQINLAESDGSLLIETTVLLSMFEQFLKSDLTKEEIIEILKNRTGLLEFQE